MLRLQAILCAALLQARTPPKAVKVVNSCPNPSEVSLSNQNLRLLQIPARHQVRTFEISSQPGASSGARAEFHGPFRPWIALSTGSMLRLRDSSTFRRSAHEATSSYKHTTDTTCKILHEIINDLNPTYGYEAQLLCP